MPEQNLQFDLKHSATVVYSAAVAKYRFVSWAGAHATAAEQVQGISELAGPAGGAGSVVTSYSFPVEAAAAIPAGSAVAPSGDGTGRAVVATGLQCGRALTAAAAAGELVTVRVQLVAGGLAPAKQAASDALVSTPGNQPSATLAATVGTPGQIVRLADGPDAGAILVWAIPLGASAYTWCWWLSPTDAY